MTIRDRARAAGGEIRRAWEAMLAWVYLGKRDDAAGSVVGSGRERYRLVRGEDGALYGVREIDPNHKENDDHPHWWAATDA